MQKSQIPTKRQFEKVPIFYSQAYFSLYFSKEDPNYCAKEFIAYLVKLNNIVPKDNASLVNRAILKLKDEKVRKEFMQACNLELTIEDVEDLFPSLLKSKEITREEVEVVLKLASACKN